MQKFKNKNKTEAEVEAKVKAEVEAEDLAQMSSDLYFLFIKKKHVGFIYYSYFIFL